MESLLIAQYEALRSEIMQRLELRQQVLTYTLLLAGTLAGLGLQAWMSGLTILCYPVFALFLAAAWAQHDNRIGQLAQFLRELEDAYVPQMGWESYRRRTFAHHHRHSHVAAHLVEVPTRGVFLVSQALAVILGAARVFPAQQGMVAIFVGVICFDVVAMIVTMMILRHKRDRTHAPLEPLLDQEVKRG